jgi:hypothetical protein
MSQTSTITPALSPSFDRARKLSRIMAGAFAIGFCMMVVVLVWMSLEVLILHNPNRGLGLEPGIRINWDQLQGWPGIVAMLAADCILVPTILMLLATSRLFFCFARGEVFAARPIAHMRAIGFLLIASFFATMVAIYLLDLIGMKNLYMPSLLKYPQALIGLAFNTKWTLIAGLATTIVAYVMEEARRIAADHAEIV